MLTLYECKLRKIAAAPFRDRVVHHALMHIVEPLLERRFIYESYACRRNKGVHRAVQRYQQWSQGYAYALKLDVARYFPNIDHAGLGAQLERHIKDPQVLNPFRVILEHSPPYPHEPLPDFPDDDLLSPLERRRGIPIGNLTSQFLANLYLNDLDHFVKDTLRAKAYLRYVDDLLLSSNDEGELHA